jgi:4-amino-4-deoxy-L-arabinose transferase-like glycosyltransferase
MAAQIVAVVASVGLILPIYGLARSLFDTRVALLAAALAALLPRAAELGRDTLSDSLGLMLTFYALWWGAIALKRADWRFAAAAGLSAGLGYLARPEVILVPAVIFVTWFCSLIPRWRFRSIVRPPAIVVISLSALAVVATYAVVKGELSEKLAIRHVLALGPHRLLAQRVPRKIAEGLDDPRWDFSPKEESDHIPIRNWRSSVIRIAGKWWEELCWLFAVMTVWGLVRQRFIRALCPTRDPDDSAPVERRMLLIFMAVYSLALVRHSALLGYLSGRHVMALVYASLPWAAAGTFVCARGIAVKLRLSGPQARWAGAVAGGLLVVLSIVVQLQPNHRNHLSRWGHWAAGRWLADNAQPTELVLDTRGWARFVSGQPGYDYWHVRQALTDSHLSYIVVGLDEVDAGSTRARTLNALLSYAATPLVDFPAPAGERSGGVRLYRYHRPVTWEGLIP